MQIYEYMDLIASIIIAGSLVLGAWSDIKTRTFPKEYWVIQSRIAGCFLVLMYLLMLANGLYFLTAGYIVISFVAGAIFYAAGLRYGSGGDWRALMYIAILAPLIMFTFTFWGLLCLVSIVIAFHTLAKKGPEHAFKRHIPWALAICVAFCLSIAIAVLTGGVG